MWCAACKQMEENNRETYFEVFDRWRWVTSVLDFVCSSIKVYFYKLCIQKELSNCKALVT